MGNPSKALCPPSATPANKDRIATYKCRLLKLKNAVDSVGTYQRSYYNYVVNRSQTYIKKNKRKLCKLNFCTIPSPMCHLFHELKIDIANKLRQQLAP